MGQAARTGKVAEPWTALCSTLQYFIVQPVRSSANWEKAGVGFLHDCVAECRSQANRLPLWAPTPPPTPHGKGRAGPSFQSPAWLFFCSGPAPGAWSCHL